MVSWAQLLYTQNCQTSKGKGFTDGAITTTHHPTPIPTPERVWLFSVVIIFKVWFGSSCPWAPEGVGGRESILEMQILWPVLHPCQQWLYPLVSRSPQHLVVSGLGCASRSAVVAHCLNSQVLGHPCWKVHCIWWVFVSVSFFDIRYPKGFCLLGNQFIDLDNLWCVLNTSPLSDIYLAKFIHHSGLSLVSLTMFFSEECVYFTQVKPILTLSF